MAITIEALPIMMKMASKIDVKPLADVFKDPELFKNGEDGKLTFSASPEKVGEIGFAVLTALTPQLGAIADDIPPFVAAFKGISIDEAKKLDAVKVLGEIFGEEKVRNFFSGLLAKKASHGA